MDWTASLEARGRLRDADVEQIADDGPDVIIYNGDSEALVVQVKVEADAHEQAVRRALNAIRRMANTQELIGAGRLTPCRFVVQTADAEEQELGILSTSAVAKRLGFSDARVRQLKDDLDFPRSFKIPGAAGDFYKAAEVEVYKTSRQPGTPNQGKPRAGDEPQLNYALNLLRQHPALTAARRHQIDQAHEATGGRFVRGKAKLLLELLALPGLEAALDDDGRAAAARAREIWPD